jgi:N-ethylmaleimide reductase
MQMTIDADVLFKPIKLGDLTLSNRIAMAPLTRNRATGGGEVPADISVDYYTQRASAGLIINEASQISQQGQGYLHTPGIFTEDQVAAWKKITSSVHDAGGRIFLQMWHVGRVSHTSLQKDSQPPVGPSDIRAKTKTYITSGFADVSQPRALSLEEIPGILADYEHGARCAKEAGFDGIELHAANGYLLDQFLKDGVNNRTDAYGGSIENRARFMLEAAEAVLKVWDKSRVGIRLSPAKVNDAADSDPQAVFDYVVAKLNELGLAYIHMIEGITQVDASAGTIDFAKIRAAFKGVYMANNGYDRARAIEAIASGKADMVSFGRAFISNPDLVERFKGDAPLNDPDRATFYGGGREGYTDYPTIDRAA